MNFNEILINGAKEYNIDLSEEQIRMFNEYKKLLISWNTKINLTSITEENEIAIKHFVDSMSIIPYIKNRNCEMIDVGTGAGFPGIPLKILCANMKIVLLDSLKKRVTFLQEVIDEIGLNGINCIHGRAEDLGRDKNYREKFDIVTARAVASLPTLLEYCMPFAKVNGNFIAMKGNSKEEIRKSEIALKILEGEIIYNDEFCLPMSDFSRTVIIIQKKGKNSTKYPRKAGKPSTKPLI